MMQNETLTNNFNNNNNGCANNGTECAEDQPSNTTGYLPEGLQQLTDVLLSEYVSDYITTLDKIDRRLHIVRKDKNVDYYTGLSNDIIAFYAKNGSRDISEYQAVFKWQCNKLYMRDNVVNRVCHNTLVNIVDDALSDGYQPIHIIDLVCILLSYDLDRELGNMNLPFREMDGSVTLITHDYGVFIELLSDLERIKFVELIGSSNSLFKLVNYYFNNAAMSIGMAPVDFHTDMTFYLMENFPIGYALEFYCKTREISAVSQGDVADMGYLDLLRRSVKSTIDMPHQLHNTARSFAESTNAIGACADKMSDISDQIYTFITAFVDRTNNIANSLTNENITNIVEVFIDFMSDLPNLRGVSKMRWITYISRILRIFVPNCMALAVNIFNTYVASAMTAISQGVDDLVQTLIVVLTGTIALKSVPEKASVNKMVEYMKIGNLTLPFAKNMVSFLTSIFQMLPDIIKAWFMHYVPEHMFYQMLIDKYGQVIDDIDRFLTYDIDTIYFNKMLSAEIAKLYVSAHDLVKDMAPYAKDTSGEFSLLREQLRKFDKLYDSYIAVSKCGVIRVCPFSLTIYGSSQIGKSTLSSAIARYMFPDVPADRVRYVIPTDPDEFWSGYSPFHRVTAEDDADQDAEYNNALQLFSIVTNAPYQPPMASVDDRSIGVKGTPYHSKMHIRCTNNAYPKPLTKVLTVEAYWKRRHLLIWAKVKDDYIVDGKVQYSPVFKHLEFYEMDPVDESRSPALIGDLDMFLIYLKNRYDTHMHNEERIVEMMSGSTDSFLANLSDAYNNSSLLPDAQGKLVDMMNEQISYIRRPVMSLKEKLISYWATHPNVERALKVVGTVTAISGTLVAMITVYNSLFNKAITTTSEAIPSGDVRTNKYKRIKRPAYAEGTSDHTAENLVNDVVRGRQAYCEVYDRRTQKYNAMCGIFIGGRYILLPNHIFVASDGKIVEENSRFVIRTDQSTFEQMFESSRLTQLKTKEGFNKDACVYECTMQVRAFKDIRHHFISEDDLTYLVNWGEAALNKFNSGIFERQLVTTNVITNQKYKHLEVLEPYTIYKGFQYDAITMSGDCGSILVVYNTRILGKLIGMHVAGERDRHRGYAELITRQMLDAFIPRIQPRNRPVTVDDKPAVILPEGNYTYYGTVPASEAVYPVSRTEIKPSVIHGMINEPKTFPVSLDRRHFGAAVSKYFNINMPINPSVRKVLMQDAFDIVDCMDGFKLGVVSEYEAINGNSKYPYFERMNMSTSPGLPYKKINKGKGKEFFFVRDEVHNWLVSHSHLRTAIDTRIAMAKQGLSYDSTWMDIPKDERRKPNKTTRMIITPPLDYQIVFRMYFMDYIVAFYNNKLRFHSAVGINPYSYDWTEMANNLLAVSDVGGDGDHTGFDGNILTDMLEIEIHAINHFYRYEVDHEIASRVREVLWNEIIHTPTQCVNVAYLTHCGMPSGCNCTTIVNTNVNDRYYKLAWLGLAPEDKRTMKSFYEHVKVYCYGDDSISAIKREALPFYNYTTIADNLALYGIKFTMADKSGKMLESKPVLDCTFLKNAFRREGMVYHALMDENTLYDMVNWVRESDDDYAATIVNCNMSLMMWYHYGPDRFAEERSKILNVLGKINHKYSNVPSLLTYDYLDDCFRMDRVPIADSTVDTHHEVSFHHVEPPKPSLLQRIMGREVTAVAQGKDVESASASVTAGEANDANTKLEENVANAVTFIEQKPTVDIDKSVMINRSEELMFGHWSIQRIFGKPQRIGTYAFATTNVRNDVLKFVGLPDILYKVAVWRPMMSAFTFMKYRPVFRIQLNGNKFAAGRLIAFILPFTTSSASMFPSSEGNTSGYTGFDHAYLDASSNDTVTLTAPWVYPRDWVNIATNVNGPNVAGRYIHIAGSTYNSGYTHAMRLQVLNTLNVGSGASTTIYATIWLHLEDVELCVPQMNTATSQGGTHSYITNNVNNWEKVASQTLPSNVRGDVFDMDANLKLSTMDKPNVTLSPEYFVRRAIGYMGHAVNFEHLDRLALYPGGQSDVKHSDFGTSVDEMSINYLTSKFTLMQTGSIATTNAAGSVLFYTPITPYMPPSLTNQPSPSLTVLNQNTWQPSGSKSQIPMLGYVSLPFNFWGGSMKYRFDFITNSFVTAKLYCAIMYGTASPEVSVTGVEPTSTLGYTFELNGDNKSFEIEVPYVADRPWKRVMNTQFIAANVTGNVNQNFDDVIGDTTCTGQILLYVINPLTIPNGFPTSYDFNVFVAGGKDFRLNFLSRANTPWVPIAQGIDPQPGTDLSVLGQSIMNTDLNCMSEVYTSIRDVLKRYCHAASRFTKVPGAGTDSTMMYSFPQVFPIAELIMPFFASPSGNINNPSNLFNWYLSLYRVWRGSLRFKILFTVENEQGVKLAPPGISVDYMPMNFNTGPHTSVNDRILAMGSNDESVGATSTLLAATSQTLYNTTHHAPRSIGNDTAPFVEIEVPFVYPNRVAPVPLLGNEGVANLDIGAAPTTRAATFTNEANCFGSLVVNYPRTPEDFFVFTRIYVAAGDDFRAGCQLGQPKIFYAGFKGTVATSNYSIPPDFYA